MPPPPAVPAVAPAAVSAVCVADLAASVQKGRINFRSSRSEVLAASAIVIKSVAAVLKRCPDLAIEISGHTDSTGTPASNQALSKQRADAVAAILAKAGIDAARISSAGHGSSRPVGSNTTIAGKAQNRRIEITSVQK